MLNTTFDQSLLHHRGDVFDEPAHRLGTLHGKPRIDFLLEITEKSESKRRLTRRVKQEENKKNGARRRRTKRIQQEQEWIRIKKNGSSRRRTMNQEEE
jgi:hypothetical protein